jgi:hypothetical protein
MLKFVRHRLGKPELAGAYAIAVPSIGVPVRLVMSWLSISRSTVPIG